MQYMSETHPTDGFDILLGIDEDRRIVSVTDTDKNDISLSSSEHQALQSKVDAMEHF